MSTDALLVAFATNNRIDEYLIRNLPDEAWRASPPNGKGRDIAAICAHMHNVRLMWLKSAGKTPELPAKLDDETCTKEETVVALAESHKELDAAIRQSLESDGRIKGFKPDVGMAGPLVRFVDSQSAPDHRFCLPLPARVSQRFSLVT